MTLDELDKLAAEVIMHYPKMHHVYTYYDMTTGITEYWQPTRNIAQAFECLEKLNPKYFDISKTEYAGSPLYVVSVAGTDIGSYDTKATDKDAALCIVKACLRAKGVEL